IENLVTWVYESGRFVPSAKLVGGERYSILSDYLGTPIQAYDAKGNIVWECELDIYGKVRNLHGEKTFIPFRYQGQYEDIETGLYYNRFRYYSPDTGTYISKDPIGLAGDMPNMYSYVSDSNTWIDPFGLEGILEIFSDSPKGDPIGHAFIGVTEKGKTTYIGQWPDPGFTGKDLPSIMVSDMGGALNYNDVSHLNSSDLVSYSHNLNDIQMDSLKKFIEDFDAKNGDGKGYNLRSRQCASFAYGAANSAGIKKLKMPWYKWVTPSSLSNKIKSLCK
ncbi:RHS repeat domain-containing protein, partial [Tenacibaculum maritimum]